MAMAYNPDEASFIEKLSSIFKIISINPTKLPYAQFKLVPEKKKKREN